MARRGGRRTAGLTAVVLIVAPCSLLVAFKFTKPSIANRHLIRGIACASCHDPARKQLLTQLQSCVSCKAVKKPVTEQTCLLCHKSYAALARVKGFSTNPHSSHRGEAECKTCHKGHKADQNTCATVACHPNMIFRKKAGALDTSDTD
jgi:fumarate reductase flavoprotein subunit